jgi:hypothetical protein
MIQFEVNASRLALILAMHLATVLGTRRTKNTQGRVNERYGLIM